MADYDVGVLGLSVPPTSGPIQTYRPAVSVRNNGIHDALASGFVRIYSAGRLIFETEVYSGTLGPGASGLAQGIDLWTPEAEGTYTIYGYVSCPLDQVEHNNNLAPVRVTIAGTPPTPPTPVEPHAPQHEDGGSDEVSIDGLKGRCADPQEPLPHVASHQAGGSDQLNVSSLQGELASPQTPKPHGNAYHSPTMATAADLSAHNTATTVHSSAQNLANRETSGKHAGLVPSEQLAHGTIVDPVGDLYLRRDDRMWHAPVPDYACILWDGTNPTPNGWALGGPGIPPPPPYVYIVKLPTSYP